MAGCSPTTGWQWAHTHIHTCMHTHTHTRAPRKDCLHPRQPFGDLCQALKVALCHVTSMGECCHHPMLRPWWGTWGPGSFSMATSCSQEESITPQQPKRANLRPKGLLTSIPWRYQQSGSCLDPATRGAWLENPPFARQQPPRRVPGPPEPSGPAEPAETQPRRRSPGGTCKTRDDMLDGTS